MFRNASTRVRARSITVFLNSAKLRRPEEPASTTVVTPRLRANASGKMLACAAGEHSAPMCSSEDVRVQIDQARRQYIPATLIPCVPGRRNIRARPPRSGHRESPTSRTPLILFFGSMTWRALQQHVVGGLCEERAGAQADQEAEHSAPSYNDRELIMDDHENHTPPTLQTAAVSARHAAAAATTNLTASSTSSLYASLGVKPVINGVGVVTVLGGSIMPPEVVRAMEEASRFFIPLTGAREKSRRADRGAAAGARGDGHLRSRVGNQRRNGSLPVAGRSRRSCGNCRIATAFAMK